MFAKNPAGKPRALAVVVGVLGFVVGALGGCAKKNTGATTAGSDGSALTRVVVQTDWYAQAEHGGFYQAVAEGLYRKGGLDVSVQQGGPGSFGPQKVATGQVEFSIGRSDDVMLAVQQGLPIVTVSALMQHDPQAILLHEENPVNSFADLDGKAIMAVPGAGWIRFVETRYGIKLNVIPLNFGLAQFMADKSFIQQCFITNEPYFVRRNGAVPKTLLIADTGFDPYRVIFTSQRFAREKPEVVRAFVAATAQGWRDFLSGPNAGARALIRADNDKMGDAFLDFSIAALNQHRLVNGDPAKGEYAGLLTAKRLQEQMEALVAAKMLPAPLALERFVSFEFLPPAP